MSFPAILEVPGTVGVSAGMSRRLAPFTTPALVTALALWAPPLAAAPKPQATSTMPRPQQVPRVRPVLPAGTQSTPDGRFNFTSNTVFDTRTGLTWDRAPGGATSDWASAKAYCDASTLAGKSDWRIPRVEELKSLFEKVGMETHLVAGHPFTVSNAERWTGTGDPARRTALLVANSNIFTHVVSDLLAVWCVRGGADTSYSGSNPRFSYVDGTDYRQTLDSKTGLTWRTRATSLGDWYEARSNCRGEGPGWRLATIAEYQGLLEPAGPGATRLPAGHPFHNAWSPDYDGFARWSSTQPATATATAISFATGATSDSDKESGYHSGYCVKGDAAAPRFVLTDGGDAVLDQETQVVWTRALAYVKASWDDQNATCTARAGGWRLASLREFGTIVEYTASGVPKFVPGHLFTGGTSESYQDFWTRDKDQYTAYKTFDIARAQPRAYSKNTKLYGWCVRPNLP